MTKKRSAARMKAPFLNGEYRCTYAKEESVEIPGAHGKLVLEAIDHSTGRYELVFFCRGARETEKGTFTLKGDMMELKIRESNYPAGPIEGSKVRYKIEGDVLTMVYIEPETGVNLLLQVWQRIKPLGP